MTQYEHANCPTNNVHCLADYVNLLANIYDKSLQCSGICSGNAPILIFLVLISNECMFGLVFAGDMAISWYTLNLDIRLFLQESYDIRKGCMTVRLFWKIMHFFFFRLSFHLNLYQNDMESNSKCVYDLVIVRDYIVWTISVSRNNTCKRSVQSKEDPGFL